MLSYHSILVFNVKILKIVPVHKVKEPIIFNLDKPKRKHIKFLESILFGFGLSKLGDYKIKMIF